MNEKWTGHYVYGEGYPDNLYGQAVRFDIKWINDDGSLTGTCTDEITEKHYNHRPATVKGFIEGSLISFIKQYPCLCTIDEAGNVTLYENQPAHEIHYSGTLINDHFEGEWEISMVCITEGGYPQEYICMGTWALYKE
jgi:hypothetical protein